MPPTIKRGQIATSDVLAAQLVVDMDRTVYQIDPQAAPALTILSRESRSKEASATTINWLEDEPVPMWMTGTGSQASGVTLITVSDATSIQAGDLLKVVSTGEIMRAVADPASSTTVAVTRGYAGASATTIASGAYILNLRAARMEGDVAPEAIATQKANKTNYTQIFRTPVHITGTAQAVEHYSGDEYRYLVRKAGAAHARALEEAFFHGRKKEDTSTGAKPIRLLGGVDEYISTNTLDAGGALTEPEFLDWLGAVFRYSPNGGPGGKKWLFASQELINTINSWGLAKLQLNDDASREYGMKITRYVSGFGDLNVVYHPLLEQGYSGYGYVIDPGSVIRRPLRGRSTKLLTNRQDNTEDGMKSEYLTETSFQFVTEKANGLIYGVTF